MRTLVIGDIHGCLTAFNRLLDAVMPTADDQIITLGDYVDRGPDTRGVLNRLIDLQRTHNLIPLNARAGAFCGILLPPLSRLLRLFAASHHSRPSCRTRWRLLTQATNRATWGCASSSSFV